jgi:hypothetical protein
MASRVLQDNAEDHHEEHPDEWAIPVASATGHDADELAIMSPWIRNGKVRLSTVGRVRAIGHDVVPSGEFPHADLKLREEPSEPLWEELRDAFPATVPNPRLTEE